MLINYALRDGAMPESWLRFDQVARTICLLPSLNGTPSMMSASWSDPFGFRHFHFTLKISLKVMARTVCLLERPFLTPNQNLSMPNFLYKRLIATLYLKIASHH